MVTQKTLLLTASRDFTKIDAFTYECLMTFNTDRPINGAAISPIKLHVITGGGQDAMSVTTTAGKVASSKHAFSIWCMVIYWPC